MAAIAVVLGLLLGASGPVAIGALTTFQIAQLALMGVKVGTKVLPGVIKIDEQLIAFMKTPAFRVMLAANGDAAIRWQNKQMEY